MADAPEVVVEPAKAAPEATGTAPVVEAPVSGENTPATDAPAQPAKTFTQDEVNAIVGDRIARNDRKWRHEQQLRQQPPAQPAAAPATKVEAEPQPENFASTQDYVKALAAHQAQKIVSETLTQRETQQQQAQAERYTANVERQYQERETLAKVAIPDFEDVVYGPTSVWLSDGPAVENMAAVVKHSDKGPEIAHYLALPQNREEFARIARLHPLAQAKEIGKLEAKLASAPAPRQSAAPEPIPAGKANGTRPVLETTDPRSVKQLSNGENVSAWIEADRARQMREAEARNR